MPQHRPPRPSGEQARSQRGQGADNLSQALAGTPQERSQTIARLGGPAAVARLVGRSTRTVQRWASGSIRNPKADALGLLNRADVIDRMARRGINIRPDGRPYRPIRFQGAGMVRVQGPSRTPEYRHQRRIGPEGGLEINPDTVAGMIDRIAAGDHEGALRMIERDLTRDYAQCGDIYNPETGMGLSFESLDEVSFYTDAAGEELF
jgi:hypothetical protein